MKSDIQNRHLPVSNNYLCEIYKIDLKMVSKVQENESTNNGY